MLVYELWRDELKSLEEEAEHLADWISTPTLQPPCNSDHLNSLCTMSSKQAYLFIT